MLRCLRCDTVETEKTGRQEAEPSERACQAPPNDVAEDEDEVSEDMSDAVEVFL